MSADDIFAANNGLATTQQLLETMSDRTLVKRVRDGQIVRIWHGVYALHEPDLLQRMAALDLVTGRQIVACMHTAAQLHGFGTEDDRRVHIFDPGVRMRPSVNLMVHQRTGAPLKRVQGRLASAPAWTAVETARVLRRPRALAMLDAALFTGACTDRQLRASIDGQKGRRGIVKVRDLIEFADGRAESPMESEVRLVFIDACLPTPELQYEIVDRYGHTWRVDFAWPQAKVAAEYDSAQWHTGPAALKHDRMKTARLQECGWTCVPIVIDEVRGRGNELVNRIADHLGRASRRAG